MTALMPPFNFLRAFHFFMLSIVFDRSVVDSSVACFVNQSWFIAAAAEGLLDGSTCNKDLMNSWASELTEDQYLSSKVNAPLLIWAYMSDTPFASSKGG